MDRLKTFGQFICENYWSSFYSDWGFIWPSGKISRMKSNEVVEDGHRELAERIGFVDVDGALMGGLVRFLVTRESGRSEFQFVDTPRTRQAVLKFIRNSPTIHGKVEIEMYDKEVTKVVFHKEFEDVKEAELKIPNIGNDRPTGNHDTYPMFSQYLTVKGFVMVRRDDDEAVFTRPDIRGEVVLKVAWNHVYEWVHTKQGSVSYFKKGKTLRELRKHLDVPASKIPLSANFYKSRGKSEDTIS